MLVDGEAIVIGGGGCDVVLADGLVAARHVWLALHGRTLEVRDLGTTDGTWVNDARITAPATVGIDDTIRIGDTVIVLELASVAPPAQREVMPASYSAVESDFLARLRANVADDTTREIYADWLESAGFPLRATFVRLELAGGARIETSELLSQAIRASHPDWRLLVSRAPIRHCVQPGPCPGAWHRLQPVVATRARTCPQCRSTVSYCHTIEEVERAAVLRWPCVLDAALREDVAELAYSGAISPLHPT